MHGWLRVAHAVRALTDAETDLRRRELALGLAYWAGRYQELPGRPSARPESECGVQACFDAVPVVPPEARRSGLFSHAIRVLDDDPGFAAVIEAFDPGDADLSTLLHQISCASARLYLEFPSQRITYVHCLTAASAVRLFADHLTAETLHRAVGYALQTALALHAVSADSPASAGPNEETLRLAENLPDLRYRAACSLEEHAIKFTEACLRENEIQPDPVLRLAAADAALRLDAGSGRGASA